KADRVSGTRSKRAASGLTKGTKQDLREQSQETIGSSTSWLLILCKKEWSYENIQFDRRGHATNSRQPATVPLRDSACPQAASAESSPRCHDSKVVRNSTRA